MPTYDYVCEKCEHQFESIADKPLAVCPQDLCHLKKWGKGKVKKLIGAGAGLIFKGSGFYITDYRSDKYKEAAKKDSAPASASTGAEGKPAPSTDGAGKTAKSESAPPAKKSKADSSS